MADFFQELLSGFSIALRLIIIPINKKEFSYGA